MNQSNIKTMKGIYVLILRLDNEIDIQVGKLGKLHFNKGFYAYTGSARGTGGFKRVTRHFNVAAGENTARKWHIDYLLPNCEVMYAVLLPVEADIECNVAKNLGKFLNEIPGFGCSDCSCDTHLFFSNEEIIDKVVNTCNLLTGNESIITGPHI